MRYRHRVRGCIRTRKYTKPKQIDAMTTSDATFNHGRLLLFVVGCGLFLANVRLEAQQSPTEPRPSADPADATACAKQLNRIYGAIQEYQKWHQQPPGW